MRYKIESGVPLPTSAGKLGRGKSEERLAVEALGVGDSVLLDRKIDSVQMIVWNVKQRDSALDFTCRKDGDRTRVWRIS